MNARRMRQDGLGSAPDRPAGAARSEQGQGPAAEIWRDANATPAMSRLETIRDVSTARTYRRAPAFMGGFSFA